MQISGKTFVVTGAGNGMGREVALQLAAAGAHVAAVDMSERGLAETKSLSSEKTRLSTHQVDVTNAEAVGRLVADVLEAHGSVDGVVNIAGIIHRFVHSSELSLEEMQRVMNVNFWGTVVMCQAFLPTLRSRPEASIVNMSSLSALIAFAGQTAYGASKGAVKQYTEGLYQELAGSRIEVCAIFPGNISTNISANSGVEMIDSRGKKVRATTPNDAARAIVRGIRRGSFRILVGRDARILDRLVRIAPKRAVDLIASQMASVLE